MCLLISARLSSAFPPYLSSITVSLPVNKLAKTVAAANAWSSPFWETEPARVPALIISQAALKASKPTIGVFLAKDATPAAAIAIPSLLETMKSNLLPYCVTHLSTVSLAAWSFHGFPFESIHVCLSSSTALNPPSVAISFKASIQPFVLSSASGFPSSPTRMM